MKNDSDKEYLNYVTLAMELLSEMKSHQAKIAFYATKVCDIKHGGRTASSTYTIKKFATDIGMSNKTLSEWVSVYRNVIIKLGKEAGDVTKKDWQVAGRVQSIINEQRRVDQALSGLSGRKERGSRKNASPELIKDLFKQNYDGPSFQKQFDDWNNQFTFVKNKIISRDLSLLSYGSLITMKETIDSISGSIFRHIVKDKAA